MTVRRREESDQAHGAPTARTERDRRGRSGSPGRGTELDGSAGMTLNAQAFHLGRRMTEAVVANRAQPARKNMSQIARHELHARERAGFPAIARVAILPPEGDGLVVDPAPIR